MTENTALTHAGKTVLVTGAGRGIGRAIALGFAHAGANVGIVDRLEEEAAETARMIRDLGVDAAAQPADIADFKAFEIAHIALIEKLGAFDILINNAGVSPKKNGMRSLVHEMEPEEWNQVVGINLTGSFNAARLVTPTMVAKGQGRIVNMASVVGKTYMDAVAVHYSATKAAIIGFTRHLAGELGPHGITANAIAPGRIESDMMRMVAPEVNEAIRLETPLRRFGQGSDVANMALFLTSDASTFVTGQTVDVAGGWLMA